MLKKHSVCRYLAYAISGLVLLGGGLTLAVLYRESEGIMKTLPFVCLGVGCGIFGGNLGTAVRLHLQKKNSKAEKLAEIEEQDERNIAIRNGAKAKAYDMSFMVIGALLLIFVLLRVETYVLLMLIAAYLFIAGTNIYYICKLNKEI